MVEKKDMLLIADLKKAFDISYMERLDYASKFRWRNVEVPHQRELL